MRSVLPVQLRLSCTRAPGASHDRAGSCSVVCVSGTGYCVLGGSYNGFSSFANAIVSCVMVTHAKWNFNSIITVAQQGRPIGWLFQVFTLLVCVLFFGFMNYIVLSMVYVRYAPRQCNRKTCSACLAPENMQCVSSNSFVRYAVRLWGSPTPPVG